jgi:hypothetical protein
MAATEEATLVLACDTLIASAPNSDKQTIYTRVR